MHVYYWKKIHDITNTSPLRLCNIYSTIPDFLHVLYQCIWASEIWNGEFLGHRLLELVASGENFHIPAYLGNLIYATELWSGDGGRKKFRIDSPVFLRKYEGLFRWKCAIAGLFSIIYPILSYSMHINFEKRRCASTIPLGFFLTLTICGLSVILSSFVC